MGSPTGNASFNAATDRNYLITAFDEPVRLDDSGRFGLMGRSGGGSRYLECPVPNLGSVR